MSTFLDHLQRALAPAYALGPELPGAGMSRVFEATDVALARKVVVKVLPPELAAGVNRERFRREIQFAAQLQHPHIVPLLSAGEEGELLYYTMPFIEGESLRVRLERGGPLAVRDVVRMLHDIVDALAYAHARGVVHRDIKPGNILTQGHHALVTDFGVAKALSVSLPVAGVTTSGMAIGTPAYMAPEQLAADPAADHRVDIYAVGLLAYELLSGESPFTGPSPAATLAAQLTRDPEPVAALRPDVPPALSAIIMRCLAKDPDRRPATAAELLEELDELPLPSGPTTATAGAPRAARGLAATTPIPAQAPAPASRRTAALVAGGLLLAGAAGATVLAFHDRHPRAALAPASIVDDSAGPADERSAVTLNGVPVPPTQPAPSGATRTLTRQDSLAIADAVRKQLEQSARRTATRATATAGAAGQHDASQGARVVLRQQLIDSVVRVSVNEWSHVPDLARLRGLPQALAKVAPGTAPQVVVREGAPRAAGPAARAGAREIVITEPEVREDRPELAKLGRYLARDLRNALRERRGRYAVVAQDSVRAVLARGRTTAALVDAFHPELIASIDLIPLPSDSVVVLIKLRDLSAASPWSYRVAASGTLALEDAADDLDETIAAAVAAVEEMSAAPRGDEWHPGRQLPAPPPTP